jgi:hypothetical protein
VSPSALSKSLLSLLPVGLVVDRVTVAPDRVVVAVRARAAASSCPACRRPSRRVHSRYVRRLGDLPWQGRAGRLELQVRRFRCSAPGCPRRVFAERLPAVAAPRVRRSARLAVAQRRIALCAGGEASARLASRLAMPVSGDTLLRLIRAAPLPEALALPDEVKQWSMTTLRERLVKIGARIVRHARSVTFQMAEVMVSRSLFQQILAAIAVLRPSPPARC